MDSFAPDGPLEVEDSFFSPGGTDIDPQPIAARLLASESRFEPLRSGEATILFLMRATPKEKAGRQILGEMCLPQFGGALGTVGKWMLARLCDGVPDFVMVLDATWWQQATPLQREALVFHELEHAEHARDKMGELRFTPEGNPIWALRDHDIAEFDSVVERYGAWSPDITRFVAAARRGGAA